MKTVETSNGDYRCFGILLATGAQPRTVGFKGEEEHKGHGVAYCATCDGEFFTDKELFVVGGGFAATDENGYIITDGSLKTSADGLYVAGDVCIKPLRQVVTAAGDGALAATELEKYVAQMQRETGIVSQRNEKDVKTRVNIEPSDNGEAAFLSDELKAETRALLAKLQNKLILRLCLDERPVSKELATLSEKLDAEYEKAAEGDYAPCVQILYGDGSDTGLAFYGVPTGHEFSSFILALYNATGPGQNTDGNITARIRAIKEKADIKVLVTLSCTMCPPTVAACASALVVQCL